MGSKNRRGAGDLSDPAYRESLLPQHPIIRGRYTIATPMIEACYQVFRERVWLRRRGSVLYAETTMGKTTCAEAIKTLLAIEFPTVFLVFLTARRSLGPKSFVSDLLLTCGLSHRDRESAIILNEKLLMGIQIECDKRKGDHFVLIVDEMQLLNQEEFTQLAVLGNRLQQRDISMTTLGFAQPAIQHVMSAFVKSGKLNLVARFLAEQIAFQGCPDAQTLAEILDGYDHEKIYPAESDWSFVRFFYPKAFEAGFRLKTYAPLLWEAMDVPRVACMLDSLPMDHLTCAVKHLLVAHRASDSARFRFTKAHVNEAVEASGLASFHHLLPTRDHTASARH